MLTEYNVLKPDVPRSFEEQGKISQLVMQQQLDRWNPIIVIPNIRWVRPSHDLHYIMSMAAARPGPYQYPMWSIVQVLFELANIALIVAGAVATVRFFG
jgi:hypothetical protein